MANLYCYPAEQTKLNQLFRHVGWTKVITPAMEYSNTLCGFSNVSDCLKIKRLCEWYRLNLQDFSLSSVKHTNKQYCITKQKLILCVTYPPLIAYPVQSIVCDHKYAHNHITRQWQHAQCYPNLTIAIFLISPIKWIFMFPYIHGTWYGMN